MSAGETDNVLYLLVAALIGGAEMRYAMFRLSRKMKEHSMRIAALEDGRKPPRIGEGSSGARETVARFHRLPVLILAFLLLSSGCTQADIDRAQQLSDAADAKLAAAQQAADVAKSFADASNNEKAKAAVDAANSALAIARDAADAGHKAVAAAKTSQAAGATTFNVLLAGAAALVPALAGLLGAVNLAVRNAQALRQTVAGIDNAKKALPPEAVATLHSELAKAQDESTKTKVDAAQSANAASGA